MTGASASPRQVVAAHARFAAEVAAALPAGRVFSDRLHRTAFGADASVYRLVPQVVVRAADEAEVRLVLAAARRHGTPVTFRAGGTSLSGQAVTESVLVMQQPASFRALETLDGGRRIRLGPGIIGAEANAALAASGFRIGPDPASISVARIGGIVANNASGMCCRIADDTYHSLRALRAVLADGTVLDTGPQTARDALRRARPDLLRRLAELRDEVAADTALRERIRAKYRLRNTMGYCLNAFLDFDDPVDVLAHLLVGSEGTLAFVSEVTLATVADPPHRACALVGFDDVAAACAAASSLRGHDIAAAELLDASSLRVAGHADCGGAALLVEVRAAADDALAARARSVADALRRCGALAAPAFHDRADSAYAALWRSRKGLMPSVAAVRAPGTSVIIEDVAVRGEALARCVLSLRTLFERHGYDDAIVFGHALAGNLHFVLSQSFDDEGEIARYGAFLDDVAALVADDLRGSLKAEHGTGRNMAPFVEREWGARATRLMEDVKRAFDPLGILNPGVVLPAAPDAHLRDLGTVPVVAGAGVDGCMECGFCERVCPSRDLTLTPRQRIVVLREIARVGGDGARELEAAFRHDGEATCAADGLCAPACPVGIDVGAVMRDRRCARARGAWTGLLLARAERRFDVFCGLSRCALRGAEMVARRFGRARLARFSAAGHRWSGGRLPRWHAHLPGAARAVAFADARDPAIVHFAACPGRVFGYDGGAGDVLRDDGCDDGLAAAVAELAHRAGVGVARPAEPDTLCCGLLFANKGRPDLAARARRRTVAALERASAGGRTIVVDASPCARHLDGHGVRVVDLATWLLRDVVPNVELRRLARSVTVHVPCSARLAGLEKTFLDVARACADEVVPTPDALCCGQAGDRGFAYPELPAAALAGVSERLPRRCREGYSSSRTCEIALALHAGRPYRSLAHLVRDAARAATAL